MQAPKPLPTARFLKNLFSGTFLAVQWLGFHASIAENMGSIPGRGRYRKSYSTTKKKKKKKNLKKKSLFLPNHFFPKLQLLCTSVLHFPQKNSQAQPLNGLLYPGAPFLLGVGRQKVAKGNLARAQVSPLTLVSAYCCGL